MVIEFLVKNMVILDSGGNYLYVKEVSQKLLHPNIGRHFFVVATSITVGQKLVSHLCLTKCRNQDENPELCRIVSLLAVDRHILWSCLDGTFGHFLLFTKRRAEEKCNFFCRTVFFVHWSFFSIVKFVIHDHDFGESKKKSPKNGEFGRKRQTSRWCAELGLLPSTLQFRRQSGNGNIKCFQTMKKQRFTKKRTFCQNIS